MKKKLTRVLMLTLVFTLLMSVAAYAAPKVVKNADGSFTVTYDSGAVVSYPAKTVVATASTVTVTYNNGKVEVYNNNGALQSSSGGGTSQNADNLFDWQNATGGGADTTAIKSQFNILGKNIHELLMSILNIIGFIILAIYWAKHWFVGNDAQKKRDLKDEGANYFKGAIGFFASSFIYKLIYLLATSFSL